MQTSQRNNVLLMAASISGVVGPVTFTLGWIILGFRINHYSPVRQAISELARTGASTQLAMTLVFITYGVALVAYAFGLRTLNRPASNVAFVQGIAVLGIAASPLGSSTNRLHFIFAAITYITLAALPLLTMPTLMSSKYAQVVSRLWFVAIAFPLLVSVIGPESADGLYQRIGLTCGSAWIAWSAICLFVMKFLVGQAGIEPATKGL